MEIIRNEAFLNCFEFKKVSESYFGGDYEISVKANPEVTFKLPERWATSEVNKRILSQRYFPCTNLIFSKFFANPELSLGAIVERYFEYRGITLFDVNSEDGDFSFISGLYCKTSPTFHITTSLSAEIKAGIFDKDRLDFVVDTLVPLLPGGKAAWKQLKSLTNLSPVLKPDSRYCYLDGTLKIGEIGLLTDGGIQVNLNDMTLTQAVGLIEFHEDSIKVLDLDTLDKLGRVERKSPGIVDYSNLLKAKLETPVDTASLDYQPQVTYKVPPSRQEHHQQLLGV